jgi:hypothetical protein
VDETVYAAVVPPSDRPAGERPDDPTIVAPVEAPHVEAPPGLAPPAPAGGRARGRAHVVPALLVLGVLLVAFGATGVAAFLWLRGSHLLTGGVLTPAMADVLDEPELPASPEPPDARETTPAVAEPAVAPALPTEPSDRAPVAAAAAPSARQSDASRPVAQPRQTAEPARSAAAVPASLPSAPPVVQPSPAPPAAGLPPVAVSAAEQVPAPPPAMPRDEAMTLVLAYMEARNTSQADALRRVWPSVSDAEVRRMTGEFSAPLTLVGCQVGTVTSGQMQVTCQFTQPGTTAFSQGIPLSIRRQLVFDMERQPRGWVITRVAG